MSFEVPEDRLYLESHEWIVEDASPRKVGITDFAQNELGDVVFVELPDVGEVIDAGDQFGTIESIKAVSNLYAPAAGTVTAVNDALIDSPELVNEEPYGEGWMIELELANGIEEDAVMTAADYRAQTE